ncbi:DUF4349 domain-containing protein [Chryseobacterium sp. SNU WT5]|uniref:DUF4349 domain-containing protein n=1 Tax=Chryseobacterium sp. SNU WT5 TaxID=2594269 RepID=UPI00117EF8D1|nr:DUF4349 domain-containing protein [Chryseobacterium sp. SNU WT5]QDP86519.1 DUF4349 domain-containing protein [Chryseobacterium sp. SNU WT5]
MKNIIAFLSIFMLLFSCSKQEFNDTTSSIKTADSLFTKARDGLKILDSISKRVNDSNGIAKKVIIPEIEKQTKRIDSTLKSGTWKIDSINKDIAEITKHVKTGTDVAKTLDSASQLLKNGENAISVLSKTADKILQQTQTQKVTTPPNSESQNPQINRNNTVVIPPIVHKDPLVKSARFEIKVEELPNAKSLLNLKISESNANIVSENFSQNEGIQRENISIKVPLQNFDQLSQTLSKEFGDVQLKSTASEGTEYDSNQMCDIELTFIQNEKFAETRIIGNDTDGRQDSFGDKSTNAFMSGFRVLEEITIAVLPFWPIFLIAGLILFFIRRNRNKRKIKDLGNQINTQHETTRVTSPSEIIENENNQPTNEPDYSKYLPKK